MAQNFQHALHGMLHICNFFYRFHKLSLNFFYGMLSIFTDFPAFVIVEMLSCIEMNHNRQFQ